MSRNKELAKLSRMVGMPLMGVCWPEGDYIYVAGGGGSSSSGIQNRVVLVEFKNGEVSDVLESFATGDHAVLGLAINPAGKPLVYSFGQGKLQHIDIKYASGERPVMRDAKTDTSPEFEDFRNNQETTCFCFSPDGHFFAAGCEDGSIRIFEGMNFSPKKSISVIESRIQSLDLNPSGFPLIAVIVKEKMKSKCFVLDYKSDDKISLDLPSSISEAEFRSVKFSRDGSCHIVVLLNLNDAGYLSWWRADPQTERTWSLERKQKISQNNISAFDIAPEGNIIGVSDTEGNIVVVAYPKFSILKRIKNAHMVYPTQLAFAAEGHAFASVAADASVTVIPVLKLANQSGANVNLCRAFTILLMILLVGLIIIARQSGFIEVKLEF